MGPQGDGQALQAGVQRRPRDLYRILSHILILALGVALAFAAKKRQGRSRTPQLILVKERMAKVKIAVNPKYHG